MTRSPFETIFALASGAGRAGIAVVRISGPAADAALKALIDQALSPPRMATLLTFYDPSTREKLDQGLAIRFPGPHSFTGEDVVELHIHGGRAVITAMMEALSRLPGLRLAEPGEFSRRAFEHGKLDLTEAEALADLIEAETAAQRRQALRQMEGELGRLYEGWRARLLRLLAYREAYLDFPDEDLPETALDKEHQDIQALQSEIKSHLKDGRRGERLREGIHVAIVGAPNVGKSSLLNTLAQREAAIVSAEAGTTRDIVEIHLDLGGYPFILADTAGLREQAGAVETEGIRRARARAADADLKITVFDATQPPDSETLALIDSQTLVVFNKSDQITERTGLPATLQGQPVLLISTQTGEGIGTLLQFLEQRLKILWEAQTGPPLTRVRHRIALEACLATLNRAQTATEAELRTEDLRLAMRDLGRITGRVDVEDILDMIFREFCIGK